GSSTNSSLSLCANTSAARVMGGRSPAPEGPSLMGSDPPPPPPPSAPLPAPLPLPPLPEPPPSRAPPLDGLTPAQPASPITNAIEESARARDQRGRPGMSAASPREAPEATPVLTCRASMPSALFGRFPGLFVTSLLAAAA